MSAIKQNKTVAINKLKRFRLFRLFFFVLLQQVRTSEIKQPRNVVQLCRKVLFCFILLLWFAHGTIKQIKTAQAVLFYSIAAYEAGLTF